MPPWREIYAETREKLAISPHTKDDFYKIMSEAVRTRLNADTKVKEMFITFLKYALREYKSTDGYRWASILPATFVQWLSEVRKKEITLSDLDSPNLTTEDAVYFTEEYSTSVFVQAHVRAALIKFGKFLEPRGYISKYPFIDMKVEMPRARRTIIYNEAMLDDFYNTVLFGAEQYYTLFFRIMLQTGLRPLNVYFLACGDIEYDKPQQDALDRTYYPIFIRKVAEREKMKVKEAVFKKVPPEVCYISESLKNDIVKWCGDNKLSGKGYLFKGFANLDAYDTFVRRRRESPTIASRLKFKDTRYIWYGLRDTWTSVIYALTKDPGDLIDLGGWASANIPLTVYRVSMKSCEALRIARKYEIYLPSDKRDEILDIQGRCERREPEHVPGAPVITKADLENIMSMVTKLETQLSDERQKREALEKKIR